MALWPIVAVLFAVDVIVAVVGHGRQNGVLMVASGAWALFFVGCACAVHFDNAFVFFGVPLIGAFGVTVLVLGLKALFKWRQ